jgi:hypothetical protein
MKKHFIYLLTAISSVAYSQDKSVEYAGTITAEDLKKHLTIIASDSLEGRDTGSEGQRKAAEYISKHFAQFGLTPIAPDGNGGKGYYQKFNLFKKGWKDVYVKIGKKKKEMFKDFYPNGVLNVPEEQNIPIVFAGYGIENDKYNDYKNLDVKDKAVIFFEGEPVDKNGKFLVTPENGNSEWYDAKGFQKKISIARDKGVKYIFMISSANEQDFTSSAAQRRLMLGRYNRVGFSSSTDSPSSYASFVVSKEMAAEMLDLKPKKLVELENQSDFKVAESKISFKMERGDVPVETMNVMGFLEGTDKKDEVIVISAHYDHVGIDEKGRIYNGADDDGSGTCAVLELAQAFAKAKKDGFSPRRSILFMTVTGEEKGLLGSQYYTDKDPIVPLDKLVCDFNIDMIGRIDKAHANNDKYTYIIGSDKLSSELHQVSEESNKKYINYELDYTFNDPKDPNRFYYRSDHYNFAKHKIPVAFYFTGVHEDYHQPGDDVEKILFPKYQQITRLVFHTAWEVANREGRLKVDSNKQ